MRLKPCIMMSPLSVSTYLDSDQISFDLVIFDEASQVRPYDAIGAVYRGSQLVVAGDQKQLPPTSFFDKLSSDDDSGRDDDEYTEALDELVRLGLEDPVVILVPFPHEPPVGVGDYDEVLIRSVVHPGFL